MGIVRIEDDQIVPDEIDGVLEGDFVCVGRDDALAGEVFAGLEVQWRAAHKGALASAGVVVETT